CARLEMLGDAPRDLVQLLDQERREIHHGARGGAPLEVRRHVGVVLHRVQVGPGQLVLTGERIAVLRLVHVPQQDHRQAGRGGGHVYPPRRARSMSAVTRTTPLSVTWKRRASASRSTPMRMSSGTSHPSSMMAREMVQPRPISACGRITERWMLVRSSMRTSENSSDSRSTAPEMMQPPDTMELTAAAAWMLSSGRTCTSSRLASK